METNTNQNRDPELWELAQKRASFKSHLATYLIVNIFLWLIWYFTKENHPDGGRIPWPVWGTFGWGVGLMFHYMGAYVYPKKNAAEREYEKLKNKQ